MQNDCPFVDDILVYGTNLEEHNQKLEKTLQILESNNVTLDRNKFAYAIQSFPRDIIIIESRDKVIHNFLAKTINENKKKQQQNPWMEERSYMIKY